MADVVTVDVQPDHVVLRDETDDVTPGGECTVVDARAVRCPRGRTYSINLGDGDDRLAVDSHGHVAPAWVPPPGKTQDVGFQLEGGDGDDVIEGSGFGEFIRDGAGTDVLRGGPGADQLHSDDGDDHLLSTAGADVIDGGGGEDDVTFFQTGRVGVSISFDGIANDGVGGQGANVLAVERAIGGPGTTCSPAAATTT